SVDAIIIQDIGLLQLLHRALPELPLHASTQMTVMNPGLCSLLQAKGVRRVILPRELSLEDLKDFRSRSALELEAFVHGALCVCYSGQCLFSSMVGGRSGNRGKCAQPCRMAYQLCDEYGDPAEQLVDGKYLLSPKDLFGYEQLSALHEIGLASWKIEGRMKRPQYVATVSRIYSRALAQLEQGLPFSPDAEDLRQLSQVFNREHSSGYWLNNPGASLMSFKRPNNRGLFLGRVVALDVGYFCLKLAQPLHRGDGIEIWVSGQREGCTVEHIWQNGKEVISAAAGESVWLPLVRCQVGDRVFKTYDAPLMESAELSYQHLKDKELHFELQAVPGQRLSVRAWDADGYQAEFCSEYVVETAHNPRQRPAEIAFAQLGRLGGTGYCIAKVSGEIAPDAMLPSSILNQCRRQLVEDLFAQRKAVDARQMDQSRFEEAKAALKPKQEKAQNAGRGLPELVALVETKEKAQAAARMGLKDIYFDALGWKGRGKVDYISLQAILADRGCQLTPYLPQVILPGEEASWTEQFYKWRKEGLRGLVLNNLGQLFLARKTGWDAAFYAGNGLNVFNSQACRLLEEQGIYRVLLSPEMNLEQLRKLDGGKTELEFFAQGPMQLMVSQYCAPGAVLGGRDCRDGKCTICSQPCLREEELFLRDEKGYSFPIRCDRNCRMHIFNSRELCLLEELPQLYAAGISRVVLDLRLYSQQRAEQLLQLYREATTDLYSFEEAKRRMPQLVKEYTKGQLNRGV
ncbi:MAG: U32 family peptidase, partial [Bacillota bacterium]|nr:U32 family peptidase [Bacillota bacterium]